MPTRPNRVVVDLWLDWLSGHLAGVPPRFISGFTLCIMLGWVAFGLVLMGGAVSDNWTVAVALGWAPWWFELAVGLCICGGAAFPLVGALCRHRLASTSWALDSFGLPLVAGGWATFGLTTLSTPPHAPGWAILASSFAGAALVRLWAIDRYARRTREAVRDA